MSEVGDALAGLDDLKLEEHFEAVDLEAVDHAGGLTRGETISISQLVIVRI